MGDLEISDGLVWGGGGKAVRRGSGHWALAQGYQLELNKPFNISCIFTSI